MNETQILAARRIKVFAREYADNPDKKLTVEDLASFLADTIRLLPSLDLLDGMPQEMVLKAVRATELKRRTLSDKTSAGWLAWLTQSMVEERRSGRTDRWFKTIQRGTLDWNPATGSRRHAEGVHAESTEDATSVLDSEGRIIKNNKEGGWAVVRGEDGIEYWLHYSACDEQLRRGLERLPRGTSLRILFSANPERTDHRRPSVRNARLPPARNTSGKKKAK